MFQEIRELLDDIVIAADAVDEKLDALEADQNTEAVEKLAALKEALRELLEDDTVEVPTEPTPELPAESVEEPVVEPVEEVSSV